MLLLTTHPMQSTMTRRVSGVCQLSNVRLGSADFDRRIFAVALSKKISSDAFVMKEA